MRALVVVFLEKPPTKSLQAQARNRLVDFEAARLCRESYMSARFESISARDARA